MNQKESDGKRAEAMHDIYNLQESDLADSFAQRWHASFQRNFPELWRNWENEYGNQSNSKMEIQ